MVVALSDDMIEGRMLGDRLHTLVVEHPSVSLDMNVALSTAVLVALQGAVLRDPPELLGVCWV